jgi:hypothetical protein
MYQTLPLGMCLGCSSVQDTQALLRELNLTPCEKSADLCGHRLADMALKGFTTRREKQNGAAVASGARASAPLGVSNTQGAGVQDAKHAANDAGSGSGSGRSQLVGGKEGRLSKRGGPSRRRAWHDASADTSVTLVDVRFSVCRASHDASADTSYYREQPSFADIDVNGPEVNQMLVTALCDYFVEPEDIQYGSYNGTLICEIIMQVRELVAGRPGALLGVLASKAMDLYRHPEAVELMKHEATIYEHLSELQGECIPRFGGIGCNPMYCFMYTLTVEQEGVPLNQVEGGAQSMSVN